MREDLLKEQLMSDARDGAEEALQPGAEEISRRARRHYRRVAVLTVTGVLLAGGVAIGVGLQRASSVPTVNRPRPPVIAAPQKAAPPASFVTMVHGGAGADSGDLAVVSTATAETIRSLAPATSPFFTVTQDRSWVYFQSSSPSQGIYRVPLAGGAVEKVTDTAESTELTVSPDGSKLIWEVSAGNRPALKVRDLARATERVLPVLGPLSGPNIITRGNWAWSPDSRQLAVLVVHGDLPWVHGADDRRRGDGKVAAQVRPRRQARRRARLLRGAAVARGVPARRGRPDRRRRCRQRGRPLDDAPAGVRGRGDRRRGARARPGRPVGTCSRRTSTSTRAAGMCSSGSRTPTP